MDPNGQSPAVPRGTTANREARAKEILSKDTKKVPEFQYQKLMNETARNWDLFYKRNTTNFFKDRHWTDREFPELRPSGGEKSSKKLLELGCGVGNFLYPLLDINQELFIYACDLSTRAVDFVKADPKYAEGRCKAFVCDITKSPLTDSIPAESLDLISALFVLSAVPPANMSASIENLKTVLKPGGIVLFRDYGLYDAAQLRFKPGSKMDENFYVRQDGTFSYFFSTERLEELFKVAGFEVLENQYVVKTVVNRKRDLSMERVFVQARFRKM
ncbi:uncharacterized protein SPPG_04381 [Spizellomyces punctatus DAOM BR117]|uniref:tRNA N(3)-methylcytidine methyltransferase n=1 Tax=Spizellomyces punctatus (strain DAOM BR117) TaxID=645134 RepID=A0A0L0HG72_SPIPD|nr:uncharacterized protein SPPG_04381 [Spizellomyces punctatus DAOM BR117]KND00037.1 hypothetical protein SPPG_04381 [Spizellomyces punctatus DAOM BR117]|eukprot:XP_016608076.1 hypothetical protein SPPG_04381 [Spizellomyces punctatus DAOM BR117]